MSGSQSKAPGYVRGYLQRNVLDDANGQIKATKATVGSPSAKGLVLIANEGESARVLEHREIAGWQEALEVAIERDQVFG